MALSLNIKKFFNNYKMSQQWTMHEIILGLFDAKISAFNISWGSRIMRNILFASPSITHDLWFCCSIFVDITNKFFSRWRRGNKFHRIPKMFITSAVIKLVPREACSFNGEPSPTTCTAIVRLNFCYCWTTGTVWNDNKGIHFSMQKGLMAILGIVNFV